PAAEAPAPAPEPAPQSSAPVVADVEETAAAVAPEPTTANGSTASDAPATRRERRLTARDFVDSKQPAPSAPAKEGWRGGLNRMTGGALRLQPGRLEQTHRARRASIQRGIAGHKTIVVVGEKGGVGKTTDTYMLGATLGRVRGGTVLAWDNNEYKGTLGIRAIPAAHDHTANALLAYIGDFTDQSHSAELVNFVRPQGANKFDVL